jgi:hypothetical protein
VKPVENTLFAYGTAAKYAAARVVIFVVLAYAVFVSVSLRLMEKSPALLSLPGRLEESE